MNKKRAQFDPALQPLRETFQSLIPLLEKNSEWYGSIWFERKASQTFSANMKQTQVSDQMSMGAVLRIYDGYTLFEQATDDLAPEALRKLATEFAARVASTKSPDGAQKRPYRPATWSERLMANLDPEIRSQIPNGVNAQTPVHFGIAYVDDPRTPTTEERLNWLKHIIVDCQRLAPQHGMGPTDLTFATARESLSVEESMFIDRESNLSQTLYRVVLAVITMSGADRTYHRAGGLGGREVIEFTEKDIGELLTRLASLKKAERLEPGKYRVLFGPVVAGVIAHEAFGHAQEADTCARGRSKAWELHKTGDRVGNDHATILNNPAIFQNGTESGAAWGSYYFDEEGWLSQEQVLLKEGYLQSPMTNLTSAIRLGIPRTANGKRETWANGVYTRQTNTYFSPGDQTLDQLMSKISYGFLATEPAGGMEDPKGMGIQVGLQYLSEVKDGKLTGRVLKGPAGGDIQMTGYVPDVLDSILGKSKIEAESSSPDQAKHPFNDAGGCGKYHKEFVYAGCGGTYLLLDQVTLG